MRIDFDHQSFEALKRKYVLHLLPIFSVSYDSMYRRVNVRIGWLILVLNIEIDI
jgi:hypothetical protein